MSTGIVKVYHMANNTTVDTFNDLVEGNRQLVVAVKSGMINFSLNGGRAISHETFRLDSEEVDLFIEALQAARKIIHPSL